MIVLDDEHRECCSCGVSKTLEVRVPSVLRQRLQLIILLGTARLTMKRLLAARSDHKPVLAFVRDTHRLPH
jgi:prolyl-tRNA editing enzyme YbaK/EbsC (Cys-tRNA(Pro) deacylase)